jgi:2-succinyl-6-hydroxy-2,4-cyclohexadiene-1-carboxylate synthase
MGGPNHLLSGDPGGPAVLFLHGFMGSAEDWVETVAELKERYYCLAVDLPGHGSSLGLAYPDSYTIEGAARAVCDLLDSLGISAPVLAGYSMGGRL